MSTNQIVIDDEALEVIAWVSCIQSLKGRGCLRVTDKPNWVSEGQKAIYLPRAREIVSAVEAHRKPIEGLEGPELPELLITSADVNDVSEAKAKALWGGTQ